MGKSFLIVAYNASPQENIAAYRSKAFLDQLFSFGHHVTLLAHRWEIDGKSSKWKVHANAEGNRFYLFEGIKVKSDPL